MHAVPSIPQPRVRSRGLIGIVLALLAALATAVVPAAQPASATNHTGTISGTVFHQLPFDGGRAQHGMVDVYDETKSPPELVTTVAADADANYSVDLEPGTYALVFYNSEDGGKNLTDFFAELYREEPLYSLTPTVIQLEAGDAVTADANLAPLFFDMFDTVFTEDIAFMRDTGTTVGCNPDEGNTLFCPEDPVTRGQMAAFMVRFFGLTAVDESISFEDIDDSIFRDDILKLATADITRGCNPDQGNTRFCPEDPVTRGQMAAFLVRAFEMSQIDESVDFDDIDGSIFHDDIRRLATAEVTRGCNPDDGNTRFCPEDPVTRGQMGAFLKRAFLWDMADGEASFMDASAARGERPAGSPRPDLTDR